MGRTASLTSKRCVLYIYSTNIGTEYFKHALYYPFFFSSKCSLFHNANLFGSSIIHILYTECAKIKKNNSGAKGLKTVVGWPGQLSRYSDYGIGYTVRCSKPCGGEIFRLNSDPPTHPPTPLYRAIKWLDNDADPSKPPSRSIMGQPVPRLLWWMDQWSDDWLDGRLLKTGNAV